jgi:hypothetical protein
MIAEHTAPILTAAETDPDGRAAHACGRALELVPRPVTRLSLPLSQPLTVAAVVSHIAAREGRECFARVAIIRGSTTPYFLPLMPGSIAFLLKTEPDQQAPTRFHLDQDGDLILMP